MTTPDTVFILIPIIYLAKRSWFERQSGTDGLRRGGGLFVSFHGVGEGKDEPWF